MKRKSEVTSRGVATLIVEDTLARDVLSIWLREKRIALEVAFGKDEVRSRVRNSIGAAESLVHGLVDRDYDGPTWGERVTVLPTHELENLLLDDEAIAEAVGQDTRKVGAVLLARAEQLKWWVACCIERQHRFHLLREGFPEQPRLPPEGISSRQRAVSYLRAPDFHRALGDRVQGWSTTVAAEEAIDRHALSLDADLTSPGAAWRSTFPGKELLRGVRAELAPTFSDRELALRVARLLRRRIPACIDDLKIRLLEPAREG